MSIQITLPEGATIMSHRVNTNWKLSKNNKGQYRISREYYDELLSYQGNGIKFCFTNTGPITREMLLSSPIATTEMLDTRIGKLLYDHHPIIVIEED